MMKLILTTCIVLSFTIGLQTAPAKKLQISIDNQRITWTSAPIFKNGAWLVPLESFCKQLGLKVEYPDGGEMAVICDEGESELCVPLQFGEGVFNIDSIAYTKLESITQPFDFEIYKVSKTQLEVISPEYLAPEFTLPDLNGDPTRLQDFRGKKTLLYIWGSW